MTWLLRVLACATAALAPLEGYLLELHGQLAKAAPLLLTAVWLAQRVRERRMPQSHPVHGVLALFAVVLLASTALHAGGPYAVDYLLRWLPFLVITVVLVDVAAREVPVRALLASIVGGAAVAAVGALHSLVAEGETRATGPLEDPNDLAYFLVAALPLLVALIGGRRSAVRSAGLAATALVLVAGAAATFSRGGGLALTAALGWLVARRALPLRAVAGGAAALAGVGLGVLLLAGPTLDRALQEKSYIAGTNVDTRELRWQAAARMLTEHPVLGVGPGGFRGGYAAASHNAEVDEQTPVAHNMYLEVAAELGLPGFGLFAGLLAVAAVSSERVLRAGARRPMAAAQASLIAVVVASTFLSQQYYLPLWSLVAVVAAADLRRRETDARAPRDQ
ncbi:O-antigen ligase family protein [Actinosynnema sp. NPDC047251]|uniref:O-antigen polymerase n=1 Tax=Saccharothrix espanaensis (strain ATCC 51144 / DSM 44229 / JCM 9112 / NBRC 15066 / NRRL 15764) TaxID=1179773 RepID=K0K4I4_SACES|nr:O-antigen ligase family protein [Saccharothrix espanaensis]CCH33201.1 O-antigen polymerase [Saccharothrix espanaensis DSM 44229]